MVDKRCDYRMSEDSIDTVLDLRVMKKRVEKSLDSSASNATSSREIVHREEVYESRNAEIVRNPPMKEIWEYCYTQNIDGDTRLHIAIAHRCWREVYNLLKIAPHPCLLDIQNNNTQSALHYAVLTSQPNIARHLVVSRANVMNLSALGNTPLHLACASGDAICVRALMAPVHTINWRSFPLNRPKFPVLPHIMEHRNREGKNCLHLAVLNRHVDVANLLLFMGANLEARDGLRGWTALHIAVYNNDRPMIDFLVNEKAIDIRAIDYAGLSPYQLAVINRKEDIADLLAKRASGVLTPVDMEISSDNSSSTDTGDEIYVDDTPPKSSRLRKNK